MPKDRSEVELRVSQEIKNHQDWMYETGQAIRTLKEGLAALAVVHERNLSKVDSAHKSVLIEFENLQQEVVNKLDDVCQRIGDLETRCAQLQLQVGDKLHEFSNKYATLESCVNSGAFIWGRLKTIEDRFKTERDFVDTEFWKTRSQLKDQIDSLRKEIPSVEEFKPLKKDMEDTHQAFKVDFNGLVREIALLKKAVSYDQKKFENVYTLIERLKEGKQ